MIIGKGKPIKDVLSMIEPYSKIILAGCRGCVTVCSAGGEKEVEILSSALSLARKNEGKEIEIKEVTLERQCDPEYLEQVRSFVDDYEAVVSIACGAGIQFMAEMYRKTPVYPGIDTNFIGVAVEQGVWTERCQACGNCKLHLTGGICPIARCAKSLLNGPCGGSASGKCEVDPET
ncbi:MAG: methylenetetrahydrofolate reductase C-terminal domain-containing protein, partial [Thermodesulfobacteriota bacterium]